LVLVCNIFGKTGAIDNIYLSAPRQQPLTPSSLVHVLLVASILIHRHLSTIY